MTHLLDTSALLAHFLAQPGRPDARALIEAGRAGVCCITWMEFSGVLRARGMPPHAISNALAIYRELLESKPVDDAVANHAIDVRTATPRRLTGVDALIAGCAIAANATLVHADAHFAAIPASLLKQQRLPSS